MLLDEGRAKGGRASDRVLESLHSLRITPPGAPATLLTLGHVVGLPVVQASQDGGAGAGCDSGVHGVDVVTEVQAPIAAPAAAARRHRQRRTGGGEVLVQMRQRHVHHGADAVLVHLRGRVQAAVKQPRLPPPPPPPLPFACHTSCMVNALMPRLLMALVREGGGEGGCQHDEDGTRDIWPMRFAARTVVPPRPHPAAPRTPAAAPGAGPVPRRATRAQAQRCSQTSCQGSSAACLPATGAARHGTAGRGGAGQGEC
jgi:hypothetical protein